MLACAPLVCHIVDDDGFADAFDGARLIIRSQANAPYPASRFTANRDKAAELYDERFCRMWEFYLGAAELGFLHGSNMVFQLLLARERDAVPLNRNFIVDAERAMRGKAR